MQKWINCIFSSNGTFSSKRWIKHGGGAERCRTRCKCVRLLHGPLTCETLREAALQRYLPRARTHTHTHTHTHTRSGDRAAGLIWDLQRRGLCSWCAITRKLKPNAFGCKWEPVRAQSLVSGATTEHWRFYSKKSNLYHQFFILEFTVNLNGTNNTF